MAVIRIVANIASSHVEAAKRFYGEILGMEVVMDLGWIVTLAGQGDAAPQISIVRVLAHLYRICRLKWTISTRLTNVCSQKG